MYFAVAGALSICRREAGGIFLDTNERPVQNAERG